ncbi:TatD family hydrolase [Aestuariimicrobium ganziense]|uniref:TatD family hydrolase n=1 Tax=Aestuariimicrobium ganziense TaxID=2773677 RepID=UPI00194537A6|nr:TatD family hydrolase [Aestuariimicrobium ganziense]
MSRPEPIRTREEFEASGLPGLPETLPRPVADSHTHIDSTTEYSGLDAALSLDLAAEVGVSHVVQIGCDVDSSRYAVELAAREPRVVAAIAMHPNDAARAGDNLPAHLEAIAALAAAGSHVRAVGETGLDFYRTRDADAQQRQRTSFAFHIDLAKQHDLTLVVHDRDAHPAILEVLDAEGAPDRVVMHCFSGDAEFARQCVERGFWLSFPGVVTFSSAGSLREALAVTPDEQLLVETDAPYLTPAPVRGRPNAPYLVPHTVRFVADQRGVGDPDGLAGLCDQLLANTFAAFGGAWGAAADGGAQHG